MKISRKNIPEGQNIKCEGPEVRNELEWFMQ